jgi:hypothetical protein
VVKSFQGRALVAVVDELGHGAKAAEAAKLAIATLEDHASEPVTSLIQQCLNALTNTRGVVMSLASFNVSRGNMTWLGVGNVEGLLIRAGNDASPKCQSLLLRSGVVGARLSVLQVATTTVSRGDLLIFATDGQEALRLIAKLKPHIAIFDLAMPLLNGIEASREALRVSPKTKERREQHEKGSDFSSSFIRRLGPGVGRAPTSSGSSILHRSQVRRPSHGLCRIPE